MITPKYNPELQDIDQEKKQAIATTDGPLLIIAGPGSGKTKTLVERIIYLILKKNVAPENIMVATFTDKAAKELITRVSNRLLELKIEANLHEMYIGTLHSIFLRILEDNREYTRLKKNYRFLDQFDHQYFLYSHLKKFHAIGDSELILGPHTTPKWEQAQSLMKNLSIISEEYLEPNHLKASLHVSVKALANYYELYQQLLADENCLDFSTIQVEVLNLIKAHPQILAKLQEQIQYLMIDEYQDTNTIQELILLKLASKHNNICVVGDDDQGLYRFRGATIRNILEFAKNFPEGTCTQVKLTTNYRSHPDIITFYNKWMDLLNWKEGGQSFRFDKTIKPRPATFPEIPSVLKVSSNGNQESYFNEIFNFIHKIKSEGILKDNNQIAFLFRSVKNQDVIALSRFLESKGINVFSPRSALFFEREEIVLTLGALIFIFPDLFNSLKWKHDAHLDVWDYYEYCKKSFADEIRKDRTLHGNLLKWCQIRAQDHRTPLQQSTKYAFAALFYELLQFPMFSRYLDKGLTEGVKDLRPTYNMAMFSKLLTKFEYLQNITIFTPKIFESVLQQFFNNYLRFLIDGGIAEYEDFDEYAPSGCVSFLTIHQSKGLEFPIVFTGSLGSVPRKQHSELDEILQTEYFHKSPFEPIERVKEFDFYRLYYTAFSRPQNLLILTAHEKEGWGRTPSKYFDAIYQKIPSWQKVELKSSILQLEAIKAVNIKNQYSFTSDILVYENCPLQYKFYKELEFSPIRNAGTMFGVLVHQTIEDIHKAILTGQAHTVQDDNIQAWFNANYITLVKSMRSFLGEPQKIVALNQIIDYKNRHQHNWDRIKEAEVDVSLVKESYILRGTIDLIRGENNTVEIVDFKSEKKPDVNAGTDKSKLTRYKRQLEIYAHLIEERTGQQVSKMHLYYTTESNGNPYISFNNNKVAIEQTISKFDEVVERIEVKTYDMANTPKTDKLCYNCDMRYYCNPRYPKFD